jgi:comEA protein
MVKIEKRTVKFVLALGCVVLVVLAMVRLSRDKSEFVVVPENTQAAVALTDTPSPSADLEENKGEEGADGEYKESGKININTADVRKLDEIYGVGEKTAERIAAYREEHGEFQTIEDIMKVSGIGIKKFESMKHQITVNGGAQ